MFKVVQVMLLAVLVFGFASDGQAGVWLDVDMHVNSIGQDVYVVTGNSDGAPISSLGINVQGDGNLGQVWPMGFHTALTDYNPFFGTTPIDHDSQVLFATAADSLLVPTGHETVDMLDANFTGYLPFTRRALVQVVLTGGEATLTIGMVANGVLYTLIPNAEGENSALVPEPASLGLLAVGGLMMMRRR